MTTATRETPNPNLPGPCPGTERMVWPVQTHRAQSTGPEGKKNSGDGEYFSLDFSFYRTGFQERLSMRPGLRLSGCCFKSLLTPSTVESQQPAFCRSAQMCMVMPS